MPVRGIERRTVLRTDREFFRVSRLKRYATRVRPFAIDDELVILALAEREAEIPVRHQAAFDAPWIKQHGKAAVFRIPEFFRQTQEGKLYLGAGLGHDVQLLKGAAAAHGRGKVNIKFELITAGVPFETLKLSGVQHLAQLDDSHALMLVSANGAQSLKVLPLP